MHISDPIEQLSISHESGSDTSMASISPTGGMLLDLRLAGSELISSAGRPDPRTFFMGTVLAPWPNRLRDGRYQLDSVSYQFAGLDAQENLNHGLIGQRKLDVISQEQSTISLSYEFGGDSGYPFEVSLQLRYEITESELRVEAIATNNEPEPVPFAIGFHPYFLVGEDFELTGKFSHHVTTDERMLPSGVEEVAGLSYKGGQIDDCYFGADRILLRTSTGSVEVVLEENLSHFMFYRPGPDLGSSMLAIEPMSAAANVFADSIESVLLVPGESKRFAYLIRKL